MAIVTFLFVIVIIYLVLTFFDVFFKSCSHYPYIQFLKGTGLQIRPFFIQWNTTAFNRILVRWGCSSTRVLNLWFTIGLYVTLLVLPIAIILTLYAILQIVISHEADTEIIVEPVLPGLNLPLSELGYYSFTLICCSIIHEIGHALAAVNEDVHLINVGLNVLFIIPVAYVNISNDQLKNLNVWRCLRILCAGVWHNIVFALFAWLLYMILPMVFATLFSVNEGVFISSINNQSPLLGPKGLQIGDVIVKINDCDIIDEASWTECLVGMQKRKHGLCVDSELVQVLDESLPLKQLADGTYDCCDTAKSDWWCFEYIDNSNGIVSLPPHTCLPARKIVDSFSQFCVHHKVSCTKNLHCIIPLLSNNTTLLVLKRIDKQSVIFIGYPMDLMYTIEISPFIPKYLVKSTLIPDTVMKLLRYFIMFSLGLALANVIPCIYMDGQHIAHILVQLVFKDKYEHYTLISLLITFAGTLALLFQCVYTVWSRLAK